MGGEAPSCLILMALSGATEEMSGEVHLEYPVCRMLHEADRTCSMNGEVAKSYGTLSGRLIVEVMTAVLLNTLVF
jgi:hypothetical protein